MDQRTRKNRSRRKRKTEALYTKGELNRLIDSVCHPLCESDKRFVLLDGFLHAMVEQNPPVSVRKFVKYNLPAIMKQLSQREQSQSE